MNKYNNELCLPILVFSDLKCDGHSSLKEWWSPNCFPFRNIEGDGLEWNFHSRHEKRFHKLLSNKKEIGVYWLHNDSLSVNKEELLHYLSSGCIVNKALRRILKRLLPELSTGKKMDYCSLVSLKEWEILNSSPMLVQSERLRELEKDPKKKKEELKKAKKQK